MNNVDHNLVKVLQIEPLGRGGLAHYTFCLASALQAKGLSVTVVTSNDYEFKETAAFSVQELFKLRGKLDSPAIPKILAQPLKALAVFKGALTLSREIRRSRPGIVHFQGGALPLADWLFSRIVFNTAKKSGAKVFFTAHNILPHEARFRHKFIYATIYRRVDALIVHAENNRQTLERFEPRHAAVHVIPHGDYQFFRDAMTPTRATARKKLALEATDKIVLFFGAIKPYKGLDTLIRACGSVRDQIGEFKLLIVGRPLEDFQTYESLLAENQITDRAIKILEYVPNEEVALYFQASDVLALPYKETYQSGVIQIGMAFGLPIVASDTGGLSEIITEGRCGLLFEPDDDRMLAKLLIRLLSDISMAQEMGERGKDLAASRFSWPAIAGLTLEAYGRHETNGNIRSLVDNRQGALS